MSGEQGQSFPPKKKGSEALWVVHNFIPLNDCTIKSQYPMHQIKEVLDILIKPKFNCYFSTDTFNRHWAVPMKKGDEYKAGILTPHGQYVYRRMGQGLMGAPHIYSQFTDLAFSPLPKTEDSPRQPTLIGDHSNVAMAPFMDGHAVSSTGYEVLFQFLHQEYFPRVAFGPIYLITLKTNDFTDDLDLIGFTGGPDGLRPSIKHRDKIANWPVLTCRAELDRFLWLTHSFKSLYPDKQVMLCD